jgi:Uma2 family endonuclease
LITVASFDTMQFMITADRQKAACTRYRLRVHDYHRMGEAGILTEDDHVELIDGDLIEMPPIGSRHAECVDRLNAMLSEQLHGKYRIRVQNPLELGEYGEPEPDLVIVENRSYAEAHPQAKDVRLLIEVADSSATYDRDIKLPFYARYRIHEVWLIEIQTQSVEIYREPTGEGYRHLLRPARHEVISGVWLPELKVPLAELWR